jgi:integrase
MLYDQDLYQEYGAVYLPSSLARKYKNAEKNGSGIIFPSGSLSTDPRGNIIRPHHIDPSIINKAIKLAVRKSVIQKRITAHAFRHRNSFIQ